MSTHRRTVLAQWTMRMSLAWFYPRKYSSLAWCLEGSNQQDINRVSSSEVNLISTSHFHTVFRQCVWWAMRHLGFTQDVSHHSFNTLLHQDNRVSSSGLNLMSNSHRHSVFRTVGNGRWGFLVFSQDVSHHSVDAWGWLQQTPIEFPHHSW
jgi:hypothetical protein